MLSLRDHVLGRHVDLELHTVWLDESDRVATFPLWNLSGQLTGYHSYRPEASKVQKNDTKGKYYTYRGKKPYPKHCRTVSVWGLESWFLSNTLFVFEGIFDAARVTELGYSAVAVISNDPNKDTRNWLFQVRQQRPVVAVCDPGKAGFKLASTGHTAHVMNVPGMPDADLSDAPDEYVQELLKQYA